MLVGVTKAGREDIDGMGSRAVGIHIMSEEPTAGCIAIALPLRRVQTATNTILLPRNTAILSRYAYRANGRAPSHQT